jgi:hypothetical protein
VTLFRIPPQPILALLGILLAAAGQYLHVFREAAGMSVIFFAGAVFCWVVALITSSVVIETRLDNPATPETRTRSMTMTPVISALGLALLTFLFGSDNGFNSDNVLAWFGSMALFLYAFWRPEKDLVTWRVWWDARAAALRDALSNGLHLSVRVLLLTGVLFLGVFSYFENLDGVPAELDSPHAEKILDVNRVLDGARPIYIERGLGHPPLDYFVTAAFVALTGHPLDFMALKLVDAALGVLLVLGMFLLARELFEFDVALIAAALMAIGKWPLALARQGLAYPFAPLALVLTLYYLVRALKYQHRNDFLMAGLFLGFGLYASDVLRISPLLVAVFLIGWYLAGPSSRRLPVRSYIRNSVLLFGLALIVALPILRYAIDRPAIFWNETLARLFGDNPSFSSNPLALLGTFTTNLWHAVLMFNWRGDGGWPVNVPGDPALDYVTGALFLFGLTYALFRILRHHEFIYALILIGLVLMLFPSAISLANPDENPSALFASGAIPFVFILASLPLVWVGHVIERMAASTPWTRAASVGIVLVLFVLAARANFNRYFSDFALVYRQSSWNSSEIASAIRGFAGSVGDAGHAWIVAYPDWVDARNVGINMGQVGWEQTLQNADDALPQVGDNTTKLYILSAADHDNLARLQQIFPNGQVRAYPAPIPGHDWLMFLVPGTVTPGGFGVP